jgi:murein DD-endopeptidase MepM/ murein hydrolase activator NlpD
MSISAVGDKVTSIRPPSSIAVLVLALGTFLLMLGVTGGSKLKLPKYSEPEIPTGGTTDAVKDWISTELSKGGLDEATQTWLQKTWAGTATPAEDPVNAWLITRLRQLQEAGTNNAVTEWLLGVLGGTPTPSTTPTDTTPTPSGAWVDPLANMTVTQDFRTSNGGWNGLPHRGIDLRASVGTTVKAVANGKVVYSGYGGLKRNALGALNKAYGPNAIEILTDDGKYVVYGHLSRRDVEAGARVTAGQVIGATGDSSGWYGSGPHLHIEIGTGFNAVLNQFISYFNPRNYLPGI